jgi:hypothetical protein
MSAPLARLCAPLLREGTRAVELALDGLGDLRRVMGFLRGRLEFAVRPDDIFISSYPRSGTTWLQLILHLLTTDGGTEFDHISQVTPWVDRSLAVGALTAADLEALPSPRVFKSHLPHRWLPGGARYVYVVRDGRDVAVSYYHFYRSHLRYTGSFDAFFERFLRGEVQYGSWFKHVAGWESRRGSPGVLIVRYEELKADPRRGVERLAELCELDVPPTRLTEIVERCSFEQMKRHERKFDFATEFLLQSGYSGRGFLRRGQTGEGAATLSPDQLGTFERLARRRPRLPEIELDLPRFLH